MHESFYIVPQDRHNRLIEAAYIKRGFNRDEASAAARFSAYATQHGIRTHNAIKALHLDDLFGSKAGGCQPDAVIEKIPSRFRATEVWNANRKLGQATAFEAMKTCMALADQFGVGIVSVDQAFHYLWGGGYVLDAASKGYIAYTNCTAAITEVVPFLGKSPTLGTNPHSWAFPTREALGFDIVVDWATSVISMGRVQQFQREGTLLPPDAAVDANGEATVNPDAVAALLPFGAHKGYGLSVIDELFAAFIGGSLPTLRSRWGSDSGEKHTPSFFFQVIHPAALSSGAFAAGRNQSENIRAVIADILGHGNEDCLLPGQMEAGFFKRSESAGGLLFTAKEIEAFNAIATECGEATWDIREFEPHN